MADSKKPADETVPDGVVLWPNQHEMPDGVTPTDKVPQIPDLFDDGDLDKEMEV